VFSPVPGEGEGEDKFSTERNNMLTRLKGNRIMGGLLAFTFALILAGCGDSGGVKDAVKVRLKDPDSVKFDELVVSKKGDRACIVWNAKNGFGGYGSPSIAELRKLGDTWDVVKMEGHRLDCTEEGFEALAAGEKAQIAAKVKAIATLKALGKFANLSEEVDAEMDKGPCAMLIWAVGQGAKDLAEAKVAHTSEIKIKESFLAEKLAKVNAGDCSKY
jgi:hypothetical protein